MYRVILLTFMLLVGQKAFGLSLFLFSVDGRPRVENADVLVYSPLDLDSLDDDVFMPYGKVESLQALTFLLKQIRPFQISKRRPEEVAERIWQDVYERDRQDDFADDLGAGFTWNYFYFIPKYFKNSQYGVIDSLRVGDLPVVTQEDLQGINIALSSQNIPLWFANLARKYLRVAAP